MADVLLVLGGLVFLGLTALYVRGCEAIVRSGQGSAFAPTQTGPATTDDGGR